MFKCRKTRYRPAITKFYIYFTHLGPQDQQCKNQKRLTVERVHGSTLNTGKNTKANDVSMISAHHVLSLNGLSPSFDRNHFFN